VRPLLRSTTALALTAAAALSTTTARAQTPSFLEQREDHIHKQQAVLGYLTGAAALSLAGGTALILTDLPGFKGEPKEYRQSFAMLCLIYGALNTAFVAANFAGLDKQRDSLTTPWLLEADRRRQSRALAGNAGLDMIYITLGFTLWATDKRPIVRGMGAGIALQGGFLLGFDGAGAVAMSR
jgi:hypothetical protein